MDPTIYSDHLTVPHGDDAPFTDERYRYLRHCAEAGATAASLKLKRNELLWIAARLGPDASEGIDIEALRRIATERQRLKGGCHRGTKSGRHRTTLASISRLVARTNRRVPVPEPTRPVCDMDAQ